MNRANVAGPNQGDSLQSWYDDLPIITKILLTGTLLQGAMVSFGMLNPMNIILWWPQVTNKFEIWRLLTNFLYAGKFSFPFAMHCYVLYENSKRYEVNPFNTGAGGTSSDYLYMLVLGMGFLLLADYVSPLGGVLSEPILYMIMYVWSRRSPDDLINIMSFKFQSVYLPWVYIGMRMIMGGDLLLPLYGLGAGHLYFFLIEVLPGVAGGAVASSLVKTPNWCIRLVEMMTARTQPRAASSSSSGGFRPNASYTSAAEALRQRAAGGGPTPAAANSGQALPPQNRYNWGSGGRTLGRS